MNNKAKGADQFPLIASERVRAPRQMLPAVDVTKTATREPSQTPYRPNPHEQVLLDRHAARRNAEAPAPRLKVGYDGKSKPFSLDHPDQATAGDLLLEALGTADPDFGDRLLDQLIAASSPYGQVDDRDLNFMVSVIKGVKPNDPIEAMLAAQIALVHTVTMRFGWKLAKAVLSEEDGPVREINKAARTFASLVDALKRYRSGGEQKVTVQQVSVSDNARAIVGNVNQTSRKATPEQLRRESDDEPSST